MKSIKQICIIGPSGVGKTTLANYIAARYNIDYISGSLQNKKDGKPVPHRDMIAMCSIDPDKAYDIYNNIFEVRKDIIYASHKKTPIVTDRGLIDLMVYYTLQLSPHMDLATGIDKTPTLIDRIIEVINDNDDILYIFIPYNHHEIEDNGKRVTDILYQKAVSSVFEDFVYRYLKPENVIILNERNWYNRVRVADEIFDKVDIIPKFRETLEKLWERIKKS